VALTPLPNKSKISKPDQLFGTRPTRGTGLAVNTPYVKRLLVITGGEKRSAGRDGKTQDSILKADGQLTKNSPSQPGKRHKHYIIKKTTVDIQKPVSILLKT
jgi:hypothetical protein